MRIFIFVAVLSCIALQGYAQKVFITNEKNNILHLTDNPMAVSMARLPAKAKMKLSTDNGIITFQDHNIFWIRPDHEGQATITVQVKTKKGMKTIATKMFRVTKFPAWLLMPGANAMGQLPLNTICRSAAPGIAMDCDCDPRVTLDSCTVMVLRGSKMIFWKELRNPNGVRFEEEIIRKFRTLRVKDKVLITGVAFKDGDGKSRRVSPGEYTIVASAPIEIAQSTLCKAVSPRAIADDMAQDSTTDLHKFTVTVKRDGRVIYTKDHYNQCDRQFDHETRRFFTTLHDKDEVLINNILYKNKSGDRIYAMPMRFTITPADYVAGQDNKT